MQNVEGQSVSTEGYEAVYTGASTSLHAMKGRNDGNFIGNAL